jgi:chitin disaccharide deacetylase
MRRLIINADDFGATGGVNAGVIRAHRDGVLTSASMMVEAPGSVEAARLAAEHPGLGLGLHVTLDSTAAVSVQGEVESQLKRFVELTGRPPTHIDTHRNVHRDERLLPSFLEVAERHGLPLRDHCGVHHISCFYGQWNGETHPEQISADALMRILVTEIHEGLNELCCHPGYPSGDLRSSYARERRTEVETLCRPEIAAFIRGRGIRLTTYGEVPER